MILIYLENNFKYVKIIQIIMILDFAVSNYGPFKGTVRLSMEASAITDSQSPVIPSGTVRTGILPSVTIFGPNASGKSYLFKAVSALQSVLRKRRTPDELITPYNPFKAVPSDERMPTVFRIRLLIDDVKYDYSVSYTDRAIDTESLVYYPNNYPVEVFRRNRGKENTKLIESDRLTDTTAYLRFASEYNDDVCNRVFREIRNITVVGDISIPVSHALNALYRKPDLKPLIMDAMDAADLGISDIEIIRRTATYDSANSDEDVMREFFNATVIHTFEEKNGEVNTLSLPISYESNGTIEMLSLIVPIVLGLESGGVIFIDEFGSKLHHELTRWILNLFNSDINRNHAQLIVNTHDLGLMDTKEIQRRDQILFMRKSRETGSSELYRLIDFKGITKKTNVLKDYLEGRYSAIPYTVRRDIL